MIDVASRLVLTHKLATTLEACVFAEAVLERGGQLPIDGRFAWQDNVFVARLWRNVKYERVYLRAYETLGDTCAHLKEYFDWYNLKCVVV